MLTNNVRVNTLCSSMFSSPRKKIVCQEAPETTKSYIAYITNEI